MDDNERGFEGDGGRPVGEASDDTIDLLADADEQSTESVVERLRESGPERTVSEGSVDDVLSELDDDGRERSDESDEETRLVGGEPTTTVSDDGIDEVFEKLQSQTPESPETEPSTEGDERDERDAAPESAGDSDEVDDVAATSATTDREDDDAVGSLSGGGPTRTVSEEGVDDILAAVADDTVDYASFDDVPDVEVDPEDVLPDTGEQSSPTPDSQARRDAAEHSSASPDSATPRQDAEAHGASSPGSQARQGATAPEDAESESSSSPAATTPSADAESPPDPIAGVEDEHTPEVAADGLRPDEADEAMLDLLSDVAETVDDPGDDDSNASVDAPSTVDASGETAVQWSDDGVPASARPVATSSEAASGGAASGSTTPGGDTSGGTETATVDTPGGGGNSGYARYARSVVGWVRSLLARLR